MQPIARLLLALALVPATLLGQSQTYEEKVTVSYVEIPVTVLGREGGPVRGLKKTNFEILEDGQKRAIDSFDAIDFAASGSASVVSPLNPASRRNFLLLFDLSYSNPTSIGRAQEAARGFVARTIGRRDLVAVGVIEVNRGFRFLTAFTTDRDLLKAAIEDPVTFKARDPLQIAATNPFTTDSPSGAGSIEQEDNMYREISQDLARSAAKLEDAYERARVKREVEILGNVAQSLQRLAGPKHLVLLSEGFDPRLVSGRSASEMSSQIEENSAIETGEVWKVDSDKRFGSSSSQRDIALMAERFRKADVILHAVDIQGVRVQNDVRTGSKVNSNEGLFLLANSTGGTVFRNSNDIASDFNRLSRQHEVVYILGFQAPTGRAGDFHDLKVKLVNVPNARVQHRGGYYDPGNESSVERSLSTAEVVVNDIPQDDIGLAAMAIPFPTSGANAQVPIVLELDGKDLTEHAKANTATADVFVYAFDEEGTVRDTLYQRIVLDISKVGERLRQAGIRYYGTLSVPPGKYAVKSLVRIAETDAKGYQRVDIDVPDAGDVAVLQPLFFEQPGEWIMVKGASNDKTNAPYPFVLNGESFIPAARAMLRKGEPRLFTVFVYNAEPAELSWEIAPEAKLVSETPGEEVTKYLFALEKFPANLTELGVTIRRKGSSDARRVTVPVRVQ